jgi:hypothetical protein
VPGIGKKTAERLLLELKGKLGADLGTPLSSVSDNPSDILQALVALGYSDRDAALALKALPADVGVSDGINNSGGTNPPNNLAAIKDALATLTVGTNQTDTGPEIQDIVNAYNKVFALADGGTSAGSVLTAAEFAKLGANIGEAANAGSGTDNLALLNSILDKQNAAGVDSIAKLNKLASIANAIQDRAAGGTATLTAADLNLVGLSSVTTDNLAAVLQAIAAKADNGTETDSLSSLQTFDVNGCACPSLVNLLRGSDKRQHGLQTGVA